MLNLVFSFTLIHLTTVEDLVCIPPKFFVEGPTLNVMVLEVEPLGGD